VILLIKIKKNITPEEQAVTAVPEIRRHFLKFDEIKSSTEYTFLIIACDGIWDVMKNEDAVNFVKQKIKEQLDGKNTNSTQNSTENSTENKTEDITKKENDTEMKVEEKKLLKLIYKKFVMNY